MRTSDVVWAILLSALVTFVPRVLPFALLKKVKLSDRVLRFLKYLPLSIIFALTFSNVFTYDSGQLPQLLWQEALVSVLLLWVAFRYRNLLLTVGAGIVLIALLRLI
ncbi:AzlD domain-containing protein [Streptococcus ovuberis]|uniref:AzlD domain-containing protein n=1 Tax=Streptococcus ovuberis TaxID=1936207 RepID=A0A7X6MZI6_9STRE|nr:AzlD domain-containing protein [Streptococcus ovuberis]NKZ20564.1 AzlD domain-containing protein [Streptococcus ovuberis]